jgi:hypothetical protein
VCKREIAKNVQGCCRIWKKPIKQGIFKRRKTAPPANEKSKLLAALLKDFARCPK